MTRLASASLHLKSWVIIVSKYAHTYHGIEYKELCAMALKYYKALRAKGMYPGMAIKMCIDRFGVGPYDA